MNISGPAAVAKPEMLFYAPGDLTVTLPAPKQQDRNVSECSATLRIGNSSIDFYQELSPDLLKALVEALRPC